MTEKEIFLQAWEREFQTNLKILNALPSNKLDLKPSIHSQTARDLAWSIVEEEKELIGGGVMGHVDLENIPKAPSTLQEIITTYQRVHNENVQKVKALNETDFNKMVKGFNSPKFRGDVRRADILWGGLMDEIHNRGQLSVYVNIAGANAPQATYAPALVES
jgi:uncharacterized damage-inducible protein DinB